MPLLATIGAASAKGFGFGGGVSPYWQGYYTPTTSEALTSIQVDGSGNIYVAGSYTFDPTYGYSRCYIQKYSAAGVLLWGRYYGTGNNTFVQPRIVLDSPASPSFVYMLAGRGSDRMAGLIKISASDGAVSWGRQIDGGSSWAWSAVAVSGSNIYITGHHSPAGVGGLVWVRRYDTSGNISGTQNYYSSGQILETRGAAAAPNGDLYVFSSFGSNLSGTWFRITSSLSTPTWQTYSSGSDVRDVFNFLTSDSSGNLYWGAQYISGGQQYLRLGKLNSSGTHQWAKNLQPSDAGQTGMTTVPRNISVDSSGAMYVACTSNFGGGTNTAFLTKFDTSGTNSFNRQMVVTQPSSGSTLATGSCLVSPSSTGMVSGYLNPSGSSYASFLNLPADGTKTGAYTYPARDRRFTYGTTSISVNTLSLGASSPGLTTYSYSLGTGTLAISSASYTKALNPVSI